MTPSADFFERFFNLSSDLFLVTNGQGRILRVNRGWKKLLDYEPHEIEGGQIWDFYHPDDLKTVAKREPSGKLEFPRDFEHRLVDRNGRSHWIRWDGFADPENGFFYGIGKDITSEKTICESLDRAVTNAFHSEQIGKILNDLAPIAIFQTNLRGEVLFVNQYWEALAGMEANQALGDGWLSAIHPDDQPKMRERWRKSAATGRREPTEFRLRRNDGTVSWMYGNHAPLLDMDGKVVGYLGAAMDITATKESEARLNENKALRDVSEREKERSEVFRQLIESSKDGFGYCDLDCKPIYLNRFLIEELGWQLDGTPMYQFIPEETIRKYRDEILPLLRETGGQWEGEVEFLNLKTGEQVPIWQKVFCSLDTNGRPRHFAFFGTDLRGKRESEAIILHNSKMASLGQMAAGVAHEINNPITIIHGTASLLRRSASPAEIDRTKLLSGLERIEKTALRISRIIKGLRMFSRGGDLDPFSSASLREIIEQTLDVCRERFHSQAIKLKVAEIPDHSLRCRPTQISQVLLNLLNNSLDAISQNTEKWVSIDFEIADENLKIIISDSGAGIPNEVAKRLMEPFFTTKAPGQGTGLGLPISKGIIENHGGRLFYERNFPNTQFVIELPYYSEESLATSP